jgi:riboflavin biosynthesis pyrimidine reductase
MSKRLHHKSWNHQLAHKLAARGFSEILLEGGAHLAGAILGARMGTGSLLHDAQIFGRATPPIEALALARVRDTIEVANLRATRIATDWLLEGELS